MTELDQVVVVVPAHNEIERLPLTLAALLAASMHTPIPVLIVVVLDAWTTAAPTWPTGMARMCTSSPPMREM